MISEEKCEALDYQVMSILGLAFDGVVDVAQSKREADHRITGIQGVGAEEIVCSVVRYLILTRHREES